MKKEDKQIFVEGLKKELEKAKSVILVNYAGLNVKSQQELKKRLKESGSTMVVVKNNLLKRAGEAAKIDSEALTDTVLSGQTALVLSADDPVAGVQVLGKFSKDFVSAAGNSVPKFKVGIVDGMFQDTDSLVKLSLLPGRDALLSQLLGSLMSPTYGLVGTLNGNLQKLVYILDQKSKGPSEIAQASHGTP